MTDPVPERKSLIDRVRSGLEAGGYPLEMRVARMMRQHHAQSVEQSRYYVDRKTGAIRETDVIAMWSTSTGPDDPEIIEPDAVAGHVGCTYLYLVMECKSAPSPWVIFDDGGQPRRDPGESLQMTISQERPVDGIHLGRFLGGEKHDAEGTLFGPSRVGSGIVEVRLKGQEAGNRPNKAWEAVQAAISAAYGVLADMDLDTPLDVLDWDYLGMIVQPVVITSGALFRCWLGDEDVLQLSEIQRGEVAIRPGTEPDLVRCLVVTESGLSELINDARRTMDLYID
ncbi:hypothetical protein ACWCOV_24680 [Kribbella sp. NPDC002412]